MRRFRKRKALASLLALAVSVLVIIGQQLGWFDNVNQAVQTSQPGLYRVARFDDGDTIAVDMNGTEETIRFIGVDTPETHDPRKNVQGYGFAYTSFPSTKVDEFRAAEKEATDNNRGLWSSCSPQPNEYGGFTSND